MPEWILILIGLLAGIAIVAAPSFLPRGPICRRHRQRGCCPIKKITQIIGWREAGRLATATHLEMMVAAIRCHARESEHLGQTLHPGFPVSLRSPGMTAGQI